MVRPEGEQISERIELGIQLAIGAVISMVILFIIGLGLLWVERRSADESDRRRDAHISELIEGVEHETLLLERILENQMDSDKLHRALLQRVNQRTVSIVRGLGDEPGRPRVVTPGSPGPPGPPGPPTTGGGGNGGGGGGNPPPPPAQPPPPPPPDTVGESDQCPPNNPHCGG